MHPWLWTDEEDLDQRAAEFQRKWEKPDDAVLLPPIQVCSPEQHKPVNLSLHRIKLVCKVCDAALPDNYIPHKE